MADLGKGMKSALAGIIANAVLAVVKVTTGVVGNSYALVADGIESTADIFSSAVVWTGLRIASREPDDTHPYGHGKAESLAALVVAFGLLVAAAVIAYQAVHEIRMPHHAPAWYTLVVLLGVIITKGLLSRYVARTGEEIQSTAVRTDAWHHLSDALTSAAAFVGISIALAGGKGYESADDWAALFACVIITYNGISLTGQALHEVMDGAVPGDTVSKVRQISGGVDGVERIEKVRVRKSGTGLLMDIHVQVDGNLTVTQGHEIGGTVKTQLMRSDMNVQDVVIHLEPLEDPAAGKAKPVVQAVGRAAE
jgi:cation diffusion facilitator family transporter